MTGSKEPLLKKGLPRTAKKKGNGPGKLEGKREKGGGSGELPRIPFGGRLKFGAS